MKKITYVFATFMLLFVSCNNEDIIETTPASQVNPNTSGMSDSFKDFFIPDTLFGTETPYGLLSGAWLLHF